MDQRSSASSSVASSGPEEEAPASGIQGKVLFMDDEPAVRSIAERLLTRAGFNVVCAADGSEAVDLFAAALESGPFDAVVLDLTVRGGMGGAEAIQHIRALDAEVPAVVTTGHSEGGILTAPGSHGFSAGVPKPFRAAELIAGVRQALAAREA